MVVAAAEQQTLASTHTWTLTSEYSPEAVRRATDKQRQFVGEMAVRAVLGEASQQEQIDPSTLLYALRGAAEGNQQDRRVAKRNVASDALERMYKARNLNRVNMEWIDGKLWQDGRLVEDVHKNTFLHTKLSPVMFERTSQDQTNLLVFEELFPTGIFETHNAVICSTSSTNMTLEEKKSYNFFTDTETCSMQSMSAEGTEITLETALYAGKAIPDSERHDIEAIKHLAAKKGIVIETDDGDEMLQYVLLIPKEEMPNGIVDIVKALDDEVQELNDGLSVFYGQAWEEDGPAPDHVEFAEKCMARNEQFDAIVEKITTQLMGEANSFATPLEAILRLDELSEKYCVEYALNNREINAAVFGPTAALHLEEARFFREQGEYARARYSLMRAQETADSGSCPLFKEESSGESEEDTADTFEGDCEFVSKKCPMCGAKNVKTKVTSTHIIGLDCGCSKAK